MHASRCAEEKLNFQVVSFEGDEDVIDETIAYKENVEGDTDKPAKEVSGLINSLTLKKCGTRRNLKLW